MDYQDFVSFAVAVPASGSGGAKRRAAFEPPAKIYPDCELFSERCFAGLRLRLGVGVKVVTPEWQGHISSVVIHQGIWRFYHKPDFCEPFPIDLGPGHYANVVELWGSQTCGSLQPIAW